MRGLRGHAVDSQSEMESPSPDQPITRANSADQAEAALAREGVRPERMTYVLLLLTALGVCDRSYWLYSSIERQQPETWLSVMRGTAAAPEQYRIGVKLAAWWMAEHFGWGFRHGFALMDVVSSVACLWLLYGLLERSSAVREGRSFWLASTAFVMLSCFYLSWTQFFVRPETLPCAFLAALTLWLWTPRDASHGAGSGEVLVSCGLLLVTAVLSTVRADVAWALNAGMFLVSLTRRGGDLSLRRSAAIAVSAVCAFTAAGIQLYLMRIVYPQASYGSTHALMARYDLRHPSIWVSFILFMVPVLWTGWQFWRMAPREDRAGSGLIAGSGLYLILWMILGKLDEVRIFLPFALALIPLTVDLAIRRLTGSRRAPAGEEYA
jgi:hypothetical protein